MANFKPCFRECFNINAAVEGEGDCLKVPTSVASRICKKLGPDGFTFMIASMADGSWVQLRLECAGTDNVQVTELKPGIPGEPIPTIPAGTELYFDWSNDAWEAMHGCITGTSDEEAEACKELAEKFKSDYFDIKCVDGKVCIEPKPDADSETATSDKFWVYCNTMFFVDKDGKIKSKPVADPIPDNHFDPVAVTIKNGKAEYSASKCPPVEKPSCDPCLTNQKGA